MFPIVPESDVSLLLICSCDYNAVRVGPEQNATSQYEPKRVCKCDSDTWECPSNAGGPPPPEGRTESGMRLYDLTHNVFSTSEHIKQTFHDFFQDRSAQLSYN